MKKKILYSSLIFILIFIPIITFANASVYDYSTGNITYYSTAEETLDDTFSIQMAIAIEAFVSIHMSIFVLFPISCMVSKSNKGKTFLKLFCIRVAILLFFDFFVTPMIAFVDFIAVFIGAFIVVPLLGISKLWTKEKDNKNTTDTITNVPTPTNQTAKTLSLKSNTIKCDTCGTTYKTKKIKNINPIKKDLDIGEMINDSPVKESNNNDGPIKYN